MLLVKDKALIKNIKKKEISVLIYEPYRLIEEVVGLRVDCFLG